MPNPLIILSLFIAFLFSITLETATICATVKVEIALVAMMSNCNSLFPVLDRRKLGFEETDS